MRSALAGLALLLALLAFPANAGSGSHAERGERFRRWRAELAAAQRESAEGAAGAAERRYLALLEEAQAAGEDGLPVARAHDGLGDVYRTERRYREAVPHYRAAASAWQRLLGGPQPRHAVTLHHLGICLVELHSWEPAEEVLRQAVAIWIAVEGEDSEALAETRRVLAAALERRTLPWGERPAND